MKVRAVMRTQFDVLAPDSGWAMAASLMNQAHVRHLPVLSGIRLLRVISDRDILEHRAQGSPSVPLASADAPENVESVDPDADVVDVAARMAQSGIDCFPVIEAGRLVGLISEMDLLNYFAHGTSVPAEPSATS